MSIGIPKGPFAVFGVTCMSLPSIFIDVCVLSACKDTVFRFARTVCIALRREIAHSRVFRFGDGSGCIVSVQHAVHGTQAGFCANVSY